VAAPEVTGAASEDATDVRGVRLTIDVALWLVAAAVVAGWLVLAARHVVDDYRVSHLQGVWMAAADAAAAGRLYPPIFDGEHYAGTRYMPLAILANAWATAAAGDALVGGKLLAAGLTAVLLALVAIALRRLACPWPITAALTAAIVATDTGLQAATTVGGDLLPVVLQVAALVVVVYSRRRAHLVAAGLLAGLAITSKLTGMWGLCAIATWLVLDREWRGAAIVAAVSAVTAGVILGAVQILSHGGLAEHMLAFAFAGVRGGGTLARGPNQLFYNLLGHASASLVLLPLAVLGATLQRGWRRISVFQIALLYTVLLLMVVFADLGTGANQLLDLIVLTVLAVGELAGRAVITEGPRARTILLQTVSLCVVWAVGVDLVRTVVFDIRRTVPASMRGQAPDRAARAVAQLVGPGEEVFAEDPSVYVALHRQPLVMEPFMLRLVDRAHPEWVDPLIAKIADRRFGLVVLAVPLEDRSLDYWWTDFHYGARVAAALRSAYRPDGIRGRYFLYRPAP